MMTAAVAAEAERGARAGINDVAIHRQVGERVAEIAYALEEEMSAACAATGS